MRRLALLALLVPLAVALALIMTNAKGIISRVSAQAVYAGNTATPGQGDSVSAAYTRAAAVGWTVDQTPTPPVAPMVALPVTGQAEPATPAPAPESQLDLYAMFGQLTSTADARGWQLTQVFAAYTQSAIEAGIVGTQQAKATNDARAATQEVAQAIGTQTAAPMTATSAAVALDTLLRQATQAARDEKNRQTTDTLSAWFGGLMPYILLLTGCACAVILATGISRRMARPAQEDGYGDGSEVEDTQEAEEDTVDQIEPLNRLELVANKLLTRHYIHNESCLREDCVTAGICNQPEWRQANAILKYIGIKNGKGGWLIDDIQEAEDRLDSCVRFYPSGDIWLKSDPLAHSLQPLSTVLANDDTV